MNEKKRAVLGLKVLSGMTIAMGVFGLAAGLLAERPIFIVGMPVPAWALGACVTYMGVRGWFRIPNLEKRLQVNLGGGQ